MRLNKSKKEKVDVSVKELIRIDNRLTGMFTKSKDLKLKRMIKPILVNLHKVRSGLIRMGK